MSIMHPISMPSNFMPVRTKKIRPRKSRPLIRPHPSPNPRTSWPAGADRERWTVPVEKPIELERIQLDCQNDTTATDVYFPSYQETFNPSPEDEAEAAGYELALSGEKPSPPSGWGFAQLRAYFLGFLRGHDEIVGEDQDFNGEVNEGAASLWASRFAGPDSVDRTETGEFFGWFASRTA